MCRCYQPKRAYGNTLFKGISIETFIYFFQNRSHKMQNNQEYFFFFCTLAGQCAGIQTRPLSSILFSSKIVKQTRRHLLKTRNGDQTSSLGTAPLVL